MQVNTHISQYKMPLLLDATQAQSESPTGKTTV